MSGEQPPTIDNEHCALLEFTGGELKVGYLAWITCRSATTTTTTTSACRSSSSSRTSSESSSSSSSSSWLDRAIEKREIVRVKWPVDCQVESAKRMRTLSKRCDWQYRTARIIDHGEWTAMCERRRNYRKFNQLDLDKNERKNRKRKFTSLASNSIGRAAPPEQVTQQQQQRVVIDKDKEESLLRVVRSMLPPECRADFDRLAAAYGRPELSQPCCERILLRRVNEKNVFLKLNFKSNFRCDMCERSYSRKHDLLRHVIKVHAS
ncbi:uncharacterized protein LOC106651750 [Trichogramma pretiosum]|uniref:uncharacterized protein LOC106651750 n=1 Tax=Trichogramma pretiosum TaxID=7493 RepID=UPI0006C9B4F8|nr:uncharacterized protein LOC106651750 [Trichogramma pretiosum]